MSTNHGGPWPEKLVVQSEKVMTMGEVFEALEKALAAELSGASTIGTAMMGETQSAKGYARLGAVFQSAYNQAAHGKGKERHAVGNTGFEQQPIFDMAKRFGGGSLLAQAFKKMEESQRLPTERAIAELYGAMVYCAAAVIHLENQALGVATGLTDAK